MVDNHKGFSEIERRALGLLAEGWRIHNAQGPVRANSILTNGADSIPLARSVMARLRDLGLIAYVKGEAALAVITQAGRRRAADFARES